MKLALVVLLFTRLALADDLRLSIDTDPTTYPLGGFSGWVMVKPTAHLRFGAGGFGLDFPSFLVPALDRGGDNGDGWHFGVRGAMGFAGYQLADRRGWYVGLYTGVLQTRYARDAMSATALHVTALPCIGYQWFPFHDGALRGAYLQPWAGAITWFGGSKQLGGHTFEDPYLVPIAAVHVGFEL